MALVHGAVAYAVKRTVVGDVLEVGECALQDLDVGVDVLGDGLEHHDVGEEGGELALQLHVVVAQDVQHAHQQLHPLDVEDALGVQHTEQTQKFSLELPELPLEDLLPSEVREAVDQGGALLRVALDYVLEEACEVEAVVLAEPDHHPHVDEGDFHPLSTSADHLPDRLLLLLCLLVQLPQRLLHEAGLDLGLQPPHFLTAPVPHLPQEGGPVLFHLHQDVASVAVSMDEVVLHQHLEESVGAQAGHVGVEGVPVGLVVCHRLALHEGLDQDGVATLGLVGSGEEDLLVAVEVIVEGAQVVLLYVEVNLLEKGPFH